jgi:triosephosphate isomerase
MTPDVRPLVAGNWKMNGLNASLGEIAATRAGVERGEAGVAEVALCPPFTLLSAARDALAGGPVGLGGQDCHEKPSGAYTGDISAVMLQDAGCDFVIVGHSERRAGHGETDAIVNAKAQAGQSAGLVAIICVGETRAEREAGEALAVVNGQIRGSLPQASTPANVVIAYEPIWAIGTGLTPTPKDVAEMHASIRALLREIMQDDDGAKVRILYGGSVKPANAKELLGLPNVDGALVGGASLKAVDFLAIAAAYRA